MNANLTETDAGPMNKAPVRKSTRLPGIDYATDGGYFVTICVDRMETRFGQIVGDELHLNAAGKLIGTLWESNAGRFSGITIDDYVVMPNHLHAILFIGVDPTVHQPTDLSRIIQAFKSESTVEYGRRVKIGEFPPYDRALWQRSFNDRMLRDDRDVEAARRYIEGNPYRWIERAKIERRN